MPVFPQRTYSPAGTTVYLCLSTGASITYTITVDGQDPLSHENPSLDACLQYGLSNAIVISGLTQTANPHLIMLTVGTVISNDPANENVFNFYGAIATFSMSG